MCVRYLGTQSGLHLVKMSDALLLVRTCSSTQKTKSCSLAKHWTMLKGPQSLYIMWC